MKIWILLLLSLCIGKSVLTQGPHVCSIYEGVYLSEAAFKKGKFDDSICTDFLQNYIKEGSFNRVIVTENKEKKIYKSNSIYGYTYRGKTYRFQAREKFLAVSGFFTIEHTDGLVIYTQRSGGKYNSVLNYYYSIGKTSEIKHLTIQNLERDFPGTAFVKDCQEIVNELWELNEDKALNSLIEINNLFRKHLG